jgi:hypothetical protein
MLGEGGARANRKFIYQNLTWSLVRQEKYEQALSTAQRALVDSPGDWMTTYNAAVSAAWEREPSLVRKFARMLTRMPSADRIEMTRRMRQLAFEVPRFAEKLGMNAVRVASWFGIYPSAVSVSDEAR